MRYRERLLVPLSWWLLGAGFTVSVTVAIGFYLGEAWGLAAGLAALAGTGILFAGASVLITVSDQALVVGRAALELNYIAGCRALDASSTRDRSGPRADARAYLVLRPYIDTAVEVTLDDPDDPVPYWLIATRRPAELAAALRDARSE